MRSSVAGWISAALSLENRYTEVEITSPREQALAEIQSFLVDTADGSADTWIRPMESLVVDENQRDLLKTRKEE